MFKRNDPDENEADTGWMCNRNSRKKKKKEEKKRKKGSMGCVRETPRIKMKAVQDV